MGIFVRLSYSRKIHVECLQDLQDLQDYVEYMQDTCKMCRLVLDEILRFSTPPPYRQSVGGGGQNFQIASKLHIRSIRMRRIQIWH